MNQLVGASCGAAGANDFKAVESLLVENCYQTSRANKVSLDPKSGFGSSRIS